MPAQFPRFTQSNYLNVMHKEFWNQTTTQWFSIRELFATLQAPFSKTYGDLDARKLSEFLQHDKPEDMTYFNGEYKPTHELITAMKLVCPTVWCCDYFLRNEWHWTHTGVDIILPKGTPIISFTDWVVVRTKTWDGISKNEWNCIAIKAPDGYVIWYEHLDRIDVWVWEKIKQWDQIGTCWTTWNSTQYHLHLQVDKWFAPFHPYWSTNLEEIKKYTIDPLSYIRAQNPWTLYQDSPSWEAYTQAIRTLTKWRIIKWFNRRIFPENSLKRYEAALMIDRALRLYSMYNDRLKINITSVPYNDVDRADLELLETLDRLQTYWIMKWHNYDFYPDKDLKWEELLALLWRIFYWLEDTSTKKWYEAYLMGFIDKDIIDETRWYIWKSIPRKEVFLLLATLLVKEKVL